ncbi:MAG: hypothetical protein H8E57_08385 [Candidatus Cloacimonetes bacterium]|nr:hypothetical protein [Candidatus Cloacimonadota bacterium]
MKIPNTQIAKDIVENHYQVVVSEINRFATGLCHFVYDVKLENGEEVVIRLAGDNSINLLKGGVFWFNKLKNNKIPVPDILHHDFNCEFPYVIMERLAGKDLHFVYDELTGMQKKNLAEEIVKIQKIVSDLPKAEGYGYAVSYGDETLKENKSWKDVIWNSLKRSRTRISQTGVCSLKPVEILITRMERFNEYFARIEPIPFLDDITTKNVIMLNGRLNGIVDVDELCFGDKLFHLGLTKMALLSQKSDTDYIDFISDEYDLSNLQLQVLGFYTAVCCIDFMSEIGQQFNSEQVPKIDKDRISFLEKIFYKMLPAENVLKTDLMRYGESCEDFFNEKIITELVRVVKKGKEAVVVCCKAHPDMNCEYLAVKLYREKKFRNFKQDGIYHQGRIWDKRLERGKKKGSSIVKQVERSVWVNNEFDTMGTLFDIGLKVPEPIACTDDAVVMSFIGEDEYSAPLLKDIRLNKNEAEEIFEKIVNNISTMLHNHIVHGDLSPFNILYHKGELYIIDFPQSVDPNINYNAF